MKEYNTDVIWFTQFDSHQVASDFDATMDMVFPKTMMASVTANTFHVAPVHPEHDP